MVFSPWYLSMAVGIRGNLAQDENVAQILLSI